MALINIHKNRLYRIIAHEFPNRFKTLIFGNSLFQMNNVDVGKGPVLLINSRNNNIHRKL